MRYKPCTMKPIDIDIQMLSDDDVTLDQINKDWSLYQLKKGHRYSTDDLLTAWMAYDIAGDVDLHLDIGAGLGSCGLLALWRRPKESKLVMVEAQRISHELAKRTIQYNKLQHRVEARYGDLRDSEVLPETDHFPLVTGTPPYFPVGTALTSPHPQRAACRMELRGNIFDYAMTAARVMHPDGWFVCCHVGTDPRTEAAMREAGLYVLVRQDVVFRQGKKPTLTIVACKRSPVRQRVDRPPLIIRDAKHATLPRYDSIRMQMGKP